jgi:hypothetical protein
MISDIEQTAGTLYDMPPKIGWKIYRIKNLLEK